jgi:hypothetical protein
LGGYIVNSGFTALGSGLKPGRDKSRTKFEDKKARNSAFVRMLFTMSWRAYIQRVAPTGFRPDLKVEHIKKWE